MVVNRAVSMVSEGLRQYLPVNAITAINAAYCS